MGSEIPDWVTYPQDDWIAITPAEAGLDEEKFERFLSGLDIKGRVFWRRGPYRHPMGDGAHTRRVPGAGLG